MSTNLPNILKFNLTSFETIKHLLNSNNYNQTIIFEMNFYSSTSIILNEIHNKSASLWESKPFALIIIN